MSKAFDEYAKIRESIKGMGNENVYVSSLGPSAKVPGDQIFYINNKSANESVSVTLSPRGILKKASYIDKNITEGSRTTFIAKDLEKLKATVRDQATYEAAAKMDWTKVPPREQPAVEAAKAEEPAKDSEEEIEFE